MGQYNQKLNPRTGQYNLVPSGQIITFKESVANVAALPLIGNTINDARITDDTGNLYIWSGTVWVDQGDIVDLNWSAISGKPNSTPNDIDNVVSNVAKTNIGYFVDNVNGSDSNSGTISSPFQTIQHAIDILPKILIDKSVYIIIRDSLTYNESIRIQGFIGGQLQLTSFGDPDLVLITGLPTVGLPVIYCVQNTTDILINSISLRATADWQDCVCSHASSIVTFRCQVSDNDNNNTTGFNAVRNGLISLLETFDFDDKKVYCGCRASYGGRICNTDNYQFGENTYRDGFMTDDLKIINADYQDSIIKKHTPNSDNQIASEVPTDESGVTVQDAINELESKKHTQNTDTGTNDNFGVGEELKINVNTTYGTPPISITRELGGNLYGGRINIEYGGTNIWPALGFKQNGGIMIGHNYIGFDPADNGLTVEGNVGIGIPTDGYNIAAYAKLQIENTTEDIPTLILKAKNGQSMFQCKDENDNILLNTIYDGTNFHWNVNAYGLSFNMGNNAFIVNGDANFYGIIIADKYLHDAAIHIGDNNYASELDPLTYEAINFSTFAWNGVDGYTLNSRGRIKFTQVSANNNDAKLDLYPDSSAGTPAISIFSNGNVQITGNLTDGVNTITIAEIPKVASDIPTDESGLTVQDAIDERLVKDGTTKITVGTTEPTSPNVGDLWVDTN